MIVHLRENICLYCVFKSANQMNNGFVFFLPKTFVLHEPDNDYVTATMTISNEKNVADVHVRSGMYSSDTIFDYSHVSKSKNLTRF